MGLRLAKSTHECGCLCLHNQCRVLRSRLWCRYWCVVRWVMEDHLLSPVLEQMLARCLGGRRFRYWASKGLDEGELWEYRFLLHLDPEGQGLSCSDLSSLDPS